ncbi:hypothetical protein BH10PSE11_BH10PSE11_18450 [soil metagenome]
MAKCSAPLVATSEAIATKQKDMAAFSRHASAYRALEDRAGSGLAHAFFDIEPAVVASQPLGFHVLAAGF